MSMFFCVYNNIICIKKTCEGSSMLLNKITEKEKKKKKLSSNKNIRKG